MRRVAVSLVTLACALCSAGATADVDRDAFAKAKRLAKAGHFADAETVIRVLLERCQSSCTNREQAGLWLAYAGARSRQGLRDTATLKALARAKQLDPAYVAQVFEAQATSIETGSVPHPLFPVGPLAATEPPYHLDCAPVRESERSRPIPILCRVGGDVTAAAEEPNWASLDAQLFYRRAGDDEWEAMRMNSKQTGFWQLVPCSSTMRDGVIEYYVVGTRDNQHLKFGSEAHPVRVAVVETPAKLVAFPGQAAPARCDEQNESAAESTRGLEIFASELPAGGAGPGPEPIRGVGCGHCAVDARRDVPAQWFTAALLGAALLARRRRSAPARALGRRAES